jgi:hypothetical protein
MLTTDFSLSIHFHFKNRYITRFILTKASKNITII